MLVMSWMVVIAGWCSARSPSHDRPGSGADAFLFLPLVASAQKPTTQGWEMLVPVSKGQPSAAMPIVERLGLGCCCAG